jgi:hypothetical protein
MQCGLLEQTRKRPREVVASSAKVLAETRSEPENDGCHNQRARLESSKRQRYSFGSEVSIPPLQQDGSQDYDKINDGLDEIDPNGPECPDAFLRKLIFAQSGLVIVDDRSLSSDASKSAGFYESIPEDETSYTIELATAVRTNDVDKIRSLQDSGFSLNCCNRFGESLLHIACRRGFVEIVRLILDQPKACIRISDDCGRNPLHDLCWNPSPQLQLCKWLLEREPSLFFLRDKRGFTPFDYARQEHWTIWKNFVLENQEQFKKLESDSYSILHRSSLGAGPSNA